MRVRFSLRAKGALAFLLLLAYVALVGYIVSQERAKLMRYALALERAYAQESALAKASYAVSHSMLKLQEKFFAPNLPVQFEEQTALDIELIEAGLLGLLEYYPKLKSDMDRLERDVARLRAEPSRSSMIWMRDHGRELGEYLEQLTQEARAQRVALWDSYRQSYDTISVIEVITGLLGAVFFGAALSLFLTRLAWDIRKLAARALGIVSGYRGPPLDVTRHDEVGELMSAVNRMQTELRQHEQQLELAREQRFHKEKMAAIGSLAAAVAHEINNPIAAIAGIAQAMKDRGHGAPGTGASADAAEMILGQTRRIITISRQIAELTAPHPPEHELLDLNSLVRNTCSFIAYDKRFRNIELALDLDSQIPAIEAVADHLTQVLMNLLINAADALEDHAGRTPTVRVATRAEGDDLVLTVTDNGKGMDATVLARAFEESFTTKPPDKGRGLGLFLCKSLLEAGGNRIELESVPGAGTTATVRLSLVHPQRNQPEDEAP